MGTLHHQAVTEADCASSMILPIHANWDDLVTFQIRYRLALTVKLCQLLRFDD